MDTVKIEENDLVITIENFTKLPDGKYQLIVEKSNSGVYASFKHIIYEPAEELELERRITDVLKALGIPSHIDGYNYLRILIKECYHRPEKASKYYPLIMSEYSVSRTAIERSVRSAIETGFNRCNIKVRNQIFGYTAKAESGSVTINHFVCEIVIFIREKRTIEEIG